jgi:hypothetical protein
MLTFTSFFVGVELKSDPALALITSQSVEALVLTSVLFGMGAFVIF